MQTHLGRWIVVALVVGGSVFVAACGGGIGDEEGEAVEGPVEIQVRWVVDSLPSGVGVAIFEPVDGDVPGLTASFAAGEQAPAGAPIAGDVLRTGYDEPVRFVVVLTNSSEESFTFWAAPHLALPVQAETDLVIACMCTGELYEVEAGGSWRRVVEYGLSRRSDVREPLSITHVFTRGELPAPE